MGYFCCQPGEVGLTTRTCVPVGISCAPVLGMTLANLFLSSSLPVSLFTSATATSSSAVTNVPPQLLQREHYIEDFWSDSYTHKVCRWKKIEVFRPTLERIVVAGSFVLQLSFDWILHCPILHPCLSEPVGHHLGSSVASVVSWRLYGLVGRRTSMELSVYENHCVSWNSSWERARDDVLGDFETVSLLPMGSVNCLCFHLNGCHLWVFTYSIMIW